MMRLKLLAFTIIIFIGNAALHAQTFTVLPSDSIESTYDVNDWISDFVYIRNTSGADLDLRFQTLSNSMSPLGWSVLLCTNSGCFPSVPSSGNLGNIKNGDSAHLDLRSGFLGIVGTGEIKFRIYENNNPSNADTITYRYHAKDIPTHLSDNEGVENAYLSANYPNPFTSMTTFEYSLPGVHGSLQICDLFGRNIFYKDLNTSKGTVTIDKPACSGILIATLKDNTGKVVHTRKIIAQ